MSDEAFQTNPIDSKRKPYLLGYTVRPSREDGKAYWSKVGIAWAHRDGEGYSIHMDALPVDGKLVLRTVPDEQDQTGDLFEYEPK